jgi:O-antigen/teichoic acid export membrane protein
MNKRVLGNSLIYTVNDLLLKAFTFFLLPLYTTYLLPEHYGTTDLINRFTSVAGFIIVFSLYMSVSRFYVEYKGNMEKVKRYYGTMIVFSFVSGFSFLLLFVVFNKALTVLFFEGIAFFPIVLVALVGLVFSCAYTMYSRILYAMQDAKRIVITSMAFFFVQFGFTFLFVVSMRMGAYGVLLATMITNILFCAFMIIDLVKRKLITFCIDLPILKETLAYSIPIIPHNLSTNIAQLVSRVFLNNRFALSVVGLFALASQFGTVTDIAQSSMNAAFQPWFFSQMKEGGEERGASVRQMAYALSWLSGLIFLLIALFSQEVILLFLNANYKQAWTVVPLCVLTFAVKSAYYPYINLLLYEKKASRLVFITTVSSSLVNIGLSALLIPIWNMYGSSLADIIAMILRVAVAVIIARKYNSVGFRFTEFLRIVLIVTLFTGAGLYLSYTKWMYEVSIINISIKLLIVAAYIGVVAHINRRTIQRYFKVWKAKRA